jgi:hypothetical protein
LLKRHEYSLAVMTLKHADELLRMAKSDNTQVAAAIQAHLAEASRNSGEQLP